MDRRAWRSARLPCRSHRLDRADPVRRNAELCDARAGEYGSLSQPAWGPRREAAHPVRSLQAERAADETAGLLTAPTAGHVRCRAGSGPQTRRQQRGESLTVQRRIDNHSRARRWASAIWLEFISLEICARQDFAISLPFIA